MGACPWCSDTPTVPQTLKRAATRRLSLMILKSHQPIYAFWCRIPSQGNVGDNLGPWLIEHITGRFPLFARPEAPVTKYFVGGSIVEYALDRCVIWGAGIISRQDRISPRSTFLAVRGPLTRRAVIAQGVDCPGVYGDPALLLPRFYSSPAIQAHAMGLVPHFSDRPHMLEIEFESSGIHLINVQSTVEAFVDEVCSTEFVASSSLHGLIISHAYGIPAAWIKFHDLPSGDDSKFHDYFESVGLPKIQPLQVHPSDLDPDRLFSHASLPALIPDLDLLWECCPFR